MQLYAITDRRRLAAALKMEALLERWTEGGVDFIQLREKDLDAPELQSLARNMMEKIKGSRSRLLVNIAAPESAALALAVGAGGVHLSGKPALGTAGRVRQIFHDAIVSVACHSLEDIAIAVREQVDLLLFSPVFEKISHPPMAVPQGLDALRRACAAAQGIPVFALGGVNRANAPDCLAAGAAGVAGIRLFLGDDWRSLKTR
jgi:thiamine-phosphate pyrophosphorylase